MTTTVLQLDHHPAGTVALRVAGPSQAQLNDIEGLELAILDPRSERYLDPSQPDNPWAPRITRFKPIGVHRDEGALFIEIDHAVTYHLTPNVTFRLLMRQADGTEAQDRVTGPSVMRRLAEKPQVASPARPVPPPSPPPPPPPPAASVVPDESELSKSPIEESKPIGATGVDPHDDETHAVDLVVSGDRQRGKRRPWLPWLLLLPLVLAGVGYWAWTRSQKPPEPIPGPALTGEPAKPAATGPVLDSEQAVRDWIGTNPSVDQQMAEADRLREAGKLAGGQFLIYKQAAEQGNAVAARRLGHMYDPATWTRETSPFAQPNPVVAAQWYRKAAEADDAEAQYRYAMLLKSGATDAVDGPEQAVLWLRKAAAQGHEEAKKAQPQ